MQSVRVLLPDELAEKLVELAERERRSPRDQAAVVLTDALRRIAKRETRSAVGTAEAAR